MAYVKKYNGSAWVDAAVKKYNGSSWVTGLVKKYNGSAWVQIYPDTAVSRTQTITATSGLQHYKPSSWSSGEARQGNGSSYGGASQYYGYLNLDSGSFTGCGSITGISSATFTGVRNGSGTYNNNQTIYFYRSSVAPSSTPSGLEGSFTATTGGPGSGKTMSNRAISGTTNLMNWMNGVGGKKKLYIHSTASADYLGIKPNVSVTATYTYKASTYSFESLDSVSTYNLNKIVRQDDIYHQMLIYDNEKDMTLREIIKHRTENNIPDIHFEDVLDEIVYNPYTTDYKVQDGKVYVTLHRLVDRDIPEFSVDGVNYTKFSAGSDIDKYEGELPLDFDKNRDTVHVRVRNSIKDEIRFELDIEPLILIP